MARWSAVMVFVMFSVAARAASAEKCSIDSDCKGKGNCSGGKCGGCSIDSNCGGFGRCSHWKCGACRLNSECKIGACVHSQCGGCSMDSDCKGGRCSKSRCSNWPFSTLEPFELEDDGTVVLAPWAAEIAGPTITCSASESNQH
jgi:hypothetical protein